MVCGFRHADPFLRSPFSVENQEAENQRIKTQMEEKVASLRARLGKMDVNGEAAPAEAAPAAETATAEVAEEIQA